MDIAKPPAPTQHTRSNESGSTRSKQGALINEPSNPKHIAPTKSIMTASTPRTLREFIYTPTHQSALHSL